MKHSFGPIFVTATLLAAQVAWAQPTNSPAATTNTASSFVLEPASPPLLNRIGLSYRMGVNISVDFHNLGGLQLSDPGSAVGTQVNRNYDDGYNRVDSSGNAGGLTRYWGYTSGQSVQGGNLVLQSDSTPATATSGRYQDSPQSGFELNYSRELTRGKHWRFGVEAALGYMAVSIADSQTLSYTVNRLNDYYALNGVIPELPPYYGPYDGPGALIPSEPTPGTRSAEVLPNAATITGERKVDSDVFTLRLGPYLEIPLSQKFAVSLGGGLTLALADTKFSYTETVLISDPLYGINLSSTPRSGSGSQTDWLVGWYGGGSVSYAASEKVRVFVGATFQAAGKAVNNQNGKQSVLNLNQALIFSVGANYSF